MQPLQTVPTVVRSALDAFWHDIVDALPTVIAGVVYLVVAAVVVFVLMRVVRVVLRRAFPGESPVYRDFVATVVAVFLWFAVALSFLAVVGLNDIAAAIGSAAGFVALGVSYALSEMIADAVSGVYLLRDPDFMPGDRVEVEDMVGVVTSIELRKTRFDVEGDTHVLGNADIESEWTKVGAASDAPAAEGQTGD